MKIFDTHSHYDDAKFDRLDGGDRIATIKAVFDSGIVGHIAGMSVNAETAKTQLAYSERFNNYYVACGIHPENIDVNDDPDEAISIIERLLDHPKVVAVGEIGLDYYWDENPPRDIQKIYFEKQLALAQKNKLPVVIHDREAHGDCFDIIRRFPDITAVFHCYSGSPEMARQLADMGHYISFTGNVTYKNSLKLWESIKTVPRDRLMIETDCPYMTPVPLRGNINDSRNLIYVAEKGAELLGMSPGEFIKLTTVNALRFYGIAE